MESKIPPFGTPEWYEMWLGRITVPTYDDLSKNPSVGDFRYVCHEKRIYIYCDEWIALPVDNTEKE